MDRARGGTGAPAVLRTLAKIFLLLNFTTVPADFIGTSSFLSRHKPANTCMKPSHRYKEIKKKKTQGKCPTPARSMHSQTSSTPSSPPSTTLDHLQLNLSMSEVMLLSEMHTTYTVSRPCPSHRRRLIAARREPRPSGRFLQHLPWHLLKSLRRVRPAYLGPARSCPTGGPFPKIPSRTTTEGWTTES
jgi:hypothetical protein